MGNEDKSPFFLFPKSNEQIQHVKSRFLIVLAKRFIHKQQIRVGAESPGDIHPLLQSD
jgi:hypothetical protein